MVSYDTKIDHEDCVALMPCGQFSFFSFFFFFLFLLVSSFIFFSLSLHNVTLIGKLILSVTKDTYEVLGLSGVPSRFAPKGQRFSQLHLRSELKCVLILPFLFEKLSQLISRQRISKKEARILRGSCGASPTSSRNASTCS